MNLPRLELADLDSPFDEALILIDGREEETIRIEATGARALAAELVRLVNHRAAIVAALAAAAHALRACEHLEASPELARGIAAHCEALLKLTGEAA